MYSGTNELQFKTRCRTDVYSCCDLSTRFVAKLATEDITKIIWGKKTFGSPNAADRYLVIVRGTMISSRIFSSISAIGIITPAILVFFFFYGKLVVKTSARLSVL